MTKNQHPAQRWQTAAQAYGESRDEQTRLRLAAMAGHIKERFGWNVHVPQYGEKIELI